MLNGIWDAGSLSECREIRDATYGEGSNVACWAVLTDRWDQLMFGFYPPEFYWRPVLALILFLVAISPVLYDTLPRKMLLFTAISPFVLFWLLWGGTIWGPIAVAAGFVLAWAVMTFAAPAIGQLGGTIAAIVVPILYWLFVAGPHRERCGKHPRSGSSSCHRTISAASCWPSSSASPASSCRCRWASCWRWGASPTCSSSTSSR
jgi:general L-amino acid transport system permease protein